MHRDLGLTQKTLRNHPGMNVDNRKRMMNGFLLAYIKKHNTKGDNLSYLW